MVRDAAMIEDHHNFMSYDINNEHDALLQVENFANYVL